MAPPGRHLTWSEITDFSPGLFTVSDWLIPANGSQTMTNCVPSVGGGLRAFVKPTSISTTGIANIAQEAVIGLFSSYHSVRSGIGSSFDYYLVTFNTTDFKTRVYRMDGTNGETTWTIKKTTAASAGSVPPNPTLFDSFVDGAGAQHVVFNLLGATSSDGLWSIDWLNGTVTQRTAASQLGGPVAVQDDRIYAAYDHKLRFSDSQSFTFSAANFIDLQASRLGGGIVSINAFAPSDLLIGTAFAPWILVQGDITDPIVRTMSDAHTPGAHQKVVFTEQGLAFIEPNTGVYLTGTGDQFTDISTQISPSAWGGTGVDVGYGDLAFAPNYLFAPNGLVYDFRVRSWFRLSNVGWHVAADKLNRTMILATQGVGFSLWRYNTNENISTRYDTYTWKSAPFRSTDGRQIEIREVQVICRTYDTAQIAVTVNGTTRTVTGLAAGKHYVSIPFVERDDVLDVQVVPTAGSASVEAPSIECVRMGQGSGHLLYS